MNDECRNDCVEPLRFPKQIKNRPGLPHINYRIGTYSDFREALLRKLNQNPVLKNWTYRGSGNPKDPIEDPGIALLEGASILGDILTFYQELYANEAYLRTAQWRESIADLVRLVGYRLSPGVGGKATFAFEVTGDKPVTIPAGFPIQAQLEGIDEPVDFETIEEFVAVPALSRLALYQRPSDPDINNINTETATFSLETSVLNEMGLKLEAGDRLMLVGDPGPYLLTSPPIYWQTVVVSEVRERFEHTEITIEGSWSLEIPPQREITAYKLGRSFRYFGHNAPPTVTRVVDGQAVQDPVSFNVLVSDPPRGVLRVLGYDPLPNFKSFPLNQEVEDISPGSTMLVTLQLSTNTPGVGPKYFFERQIKKVTSATLTRGALTGGTTVIELHTEVAIVPSLIYTDLRTVEFHEITGKKFTLRAARGLSDVQDTTRLYYYGDGTSYRQLNERTLQFVRSNAFQEVQVTIEPNDIGSENKTTLRRLYLNPPLALPFTAADFPLEELEEPPVVVYGNLVEANQGKTEKEAVLGNGDSRQMFQTFKLPKAPLTYHNTPGETPPEVPELEIYVNDMRWKRVASFFNRKPKEQIYIIREDANGDSWVQFGDGKTGARLPSGLKNVIAKYRTGIGAHGVLKENTTVQAGGKLDNLDKIQFPGVASGGSEPESGEKAKEAAPGKIQSLDRLVSLKDFETEALAIPGVGKVTAAWALEDNVPNVVLTLLMETGREKEFEAVEAILNHYNRCRGPQRFPITVRQGRRLYVYIDANFGLHPDHREEVVKAEIKKALGLNGKADNGSGLLSLRQRRFGQKEYATRIEGTIQNVEGVVWAKVTALGSLGETDEPSELRPPNPRPQPLLTVPCSDTQILSLYTEHLQLNATKVAPTEVC